MPVDVVKAGSISAVTVATMSDVSGGGGGIPDVSGNEPSLRKKGGWVGGEKWLKEVVPEFPELKGPKGDQGPAGPKGDNGGIPEAPNDGNLYGRKNEEWSQVTGTGGIPEAPSDGSLYGRKDKSWEKVQDGIHDVTDNQNYVRTKDKWVNVNAVIPGQLNADWDATSGAAEILNKPTIPDAQVNADWKATSGVQEILNKPSGGNAIAKSEKWCELPGGGMICWGTGFYKDGEKITYAKPFGGSGPFVITFGGSVKDYAPYVQDGQSDPTGFIFGINTSLGLQYSYIAIGPAKK